ncbi:4-hydroxy-tetrahydrodipicolinate reductase [Azospirillaceae bacterium]
MKIGLAGCAGRMGQMLIRQVIATSGCSLSYGLEPEASAHQGRDLGDLVGLERVGAVVISDPAKLCGASDVVIDFSSPHGTEALIAAARAHNCSLVIGTTGLGASQEQAISDAVADISIVRSPNMSLGVNLLIGLVERVAGVLDIDYDIEILEMHHRHKVDAPSGTALALGRAAAVGRQANLDEVSVRVRDGVTGPRKLGDIGFATLRGGDVIGDHVVTFAGEGERIELAHRAGNRQIYARGAVRAAQWVKGRPPGAYGMRDVLGL